MGKFWLLRGKLRLMRGKFKPQAKNFKDFSTQNDVEEIWKKVSIRGRFSMYSQTGV